jgi:hypothetical protein
METEKVLEQEPQTKKVLERGIGMGMGMGPLVLEHR